ncbi:phage integrase central domain-containing protein [Pantoea agglomerans]
MPKEEIKQQEQATLNTFEKVARDWHASNKHWSVGHAERVWRDMERNILPAIGKRNIADLTTRDLLHPLREVEQSGRLDVASRLPDLQMLTGSQPCAT